MTGRILIALLASMSLFALETTPDSRLRHSTEAFEDLMKTPDKGIPQDLLDKSQCVVIVPDLVKGAFLVGGKYGRGFASCRRGKDWSSPAAVRIEGGSFGLQLGGSSTDLVMLVMNQTGMERLLSDKFTIGGEAAAAAGPVGRQAAAMTDAQLHAEILTYSRSRGLFAGLSLEGSTLRPDSSENRKLYGRGVTNRQIIEVGVPTPGPARGFVAMLNRYSHEAGKTETEASNRPAPEPLSKQLSQPGGRATLGENRIHFATGKFDIPSGAEAVLSDVAKAMKDYPNWTVRIEGFTDHVGSKSFNKKLSQDRANSVMNWLIDHGVNKNRLSAKGYGESRPVADNDSEDGRAQNRRVEILRTEV